jgi:hypothetical protein
MTAIRLDATWDTDTVGMAVELDEESVTNATVTLSTGRYCHTTIDHTTATESVLDVSYAQLATVLQSALNTAGTHTYAVSIVDGDEPSAFYRITATGGNFRLSFTAAGDEGEHLREALGFEGDVASYGTTHDGFWIPKYMMLPVSGGISRWSPPHEPRDTALVAESEDGGHYSVHLTTSGTYEDWVQTVEPPASVYRIHVASALGKGRAVQWTWEDFVKHVRSARPFVRIWDGSASNTVHTLRTSASRFAPELMIADAELYYELRLDTYRDAVLA